MISTSLEELERAAALVHAQLAPTPQYPWPKLRARLGCEVWVKHENHTPTGAFKVRGGLVYLERLLHEYPEVPGVVSATRGNHGQSIAYAAARLGLAATIYVPFGNSPDQNSAMREWGATVVEHGVDFDSARQAAGRAAAAAGLHFVPSFHRNLVLGVASYALEFMRATGELDTIYVSVGMGSGICGLILARDALGLATRIVGVSARNAPAYARSFAARRVVPAPSALTFADGIATREPDAAAVELICRGADRFVELEEDEIAAAMRVYFDDTHQVAEGAGAAPLAALLREGPARAGRRAGVILSGGNIEHARYLEVLRGGTPAVPAAANAAQAQPGAIK
jgi:threonine dehydratase